MIMFFLVLNLDLNDVPSADVHEKVVHLVMRAPPQANSRTAGGGASSSSNGAAGSSHHHHHHIRRQPGVEGAQVLLGSFVVPEDNEPIGVLCHVL